MRSVETEQAPFWQFSELWVGEGEPGELDWRAAQSIAAPLVPFERSRPFSAVIQDLLAHISRPDFKLERVRDLIESDSELTARILCAASSAAYPSGDGCTSVSQAVALIGIAGVVDQALDVSSMRVFQGLNGIGARIRDHSVGTAAVGRTLALRLDRAGIEPRVFLSCLFHDIGKLLMIQSGDSRYARMVSDEPLPTSWHVKERALLGFDHGQWGAHVLKAWKLPAPILQVVARHHYQKESVSGSAEANQVLDLLRVADEIDWLLDRGDLAADSPMVARLASSPEAERAGLTVDRLCAMWNDLTGARHEAISRLRSETAAGSA